MRISDWSSDVCSSDLEIGQVSEITAEHEVSCPSTPPPDGRWDDLLEIVAGKPADEGVDRSEKGTVAVSAGPVLGQRRRVSNQFVVAKLDDPRTHIELTPHRFNRQEATTDGSGRQDQLDLAPPGGHRVSRHQRGDAGAKDDQPFSHSTAPNATTPTLLPHRSKALVAARSTHPRIV